MYQKSWSHKYIQEVEDADSGVVTPKEEAPKKKKSGKSGGANEGQGSLF